MARLFFVYFSRDSRGEYRVLRTEYLVLCDQPNFVPQRRKDLFRNST
jgi:hypothetical protein